MNNNFTFTKKTKNSLFFKKTLWAVNIRLKNIYIT